jgi:hypothetical protein
VKSKTLRIGLWYLSQPRDLRSISFTIIPRRLCAMNTIGRHGDLRWAVSRLTEKPQAMSYTVIWLIGPLSQCRFLVSYPNVRMRASGTVVSSKSRGRYISPRSLYIENRISFLYFYGGSSAIRIAVLVTALRIASLFTGPCSFRVTRKSMDKDNTLTQWLQTETSWRTHSTEAFAWSTRTEWPSIIS